jgi:8-oxo-dGTP pyrophosphatase MutT (NUDIX family)
MRLADALARLDPWPDRLPHGTRAIDPVVRPAPGTSLDRMPTWTRDDTPTQPPRRAAGLVLLYPGADGETRLVLTERPLGMRHAGQVSLPGGREDPGDEFPDGTALREAREEVGLDADAAGVRLLGRLDVVDVRVTGFLLTPVVAVADREPALVAAPREVAAILLPPVDIFLPDAPVTPGELERDGVHVRYGGYPWEGRHIWGATARVLAQLGAMLAGERP